MSGAPTPTGKPAQGLPVPLDLLRPLPAGLRKPLLKFSSILDEAPESPQDLLGLSSIAYSERLAGRQLLLEDRPLPARAKGQDAVPGKRKPMSKKMQGKMRETAESRAEKEAKKGSKAARRDRARARTAAREGLSVRAGDYINYELLLPLHYLYLSYLSELFPLPPAPAEGVPTATPAGPGRLANGLGFENLQSKIVKAEFIGAKVRVKRAKNASLIGVEGIVVMESAETFHLACKGDVLKVIPKKNSLFTLSFPAYSFASLADLQLEDCPVSDAPEPTATYAPPISVTEAVLARTPRVEIDILGGAFRFRGSDRAGRRFKVANGGGGWAEEWAGKLEWE